MNPYTENPYASPEEPKVVYGGVGEPALPLTMSLSYRAGLTRRPCEMSVTEDRMVISGPSLDEPITILREDASRQVELHLHDMTMVVRGNDGRRYSLTYPRHDRERSLTLARLETWMAPQLTNDPEASGRRVIDCLKKWTSGNVHIVLLLLAGMPLMPFVFPIADIRPGLLIQFGTLAVLNAVFLLLLYFRQMWVHYLMIASYLLIGFAVLIGAVNPLGIFISGLVIYQSAKALREYIRLRPHVRI